MSALKRYRVWAEVEECNGESTAELHQEEAQFGVWVDIEDAQRAIKEAIDSTWMIAKDALPGYDTRVEIAYHRKGDVSSKSVGFGYRSNTDRQGEHWVLDTGRELNICDNIVYAWRPEPYPPAITFDL